jgi:hypothetical protein
MDLCKKKLKEKHNINAVSENIKFTDMRAKLGKRFVEPRLYPSF